MERTNQESSFIGTVVTWLPRDVIKQNKGEDEGQGEEGWR